MEKNIINELNSLGIKKYNFKKNYTEIQNVKKTILNKYKNEIDWIEIENIGTKYIVRYEPRVINKQNEEKKLRNIIAKKDAVIRHLNISNGQIIKEVNSYVKKGDVIVSGYIKLNDNIKDTVSSSGSVYGEVWYNISITYPFKYYEEYETGKSKNVLVIKFLNNKIELFNFNKYKTKSIKEKIILKNNILPISLVLQKQKELYIINENNTEEELIEKAINYSKEKIEKKLRENEYVKDYKILNKVKHMDSITLNIFFSVVENITEYQSIEEYKEETNENN